MKLNPPNKILLSLFILFSCTQAKHKLSDGNNIEILLPVINTQVENFIASAEKYSFSKVSLFTVRFSKEQDIYKVKFDNIGPAKCDEFIGVVKYHDKTVFFFGDKESEKFFKINQRISCEQFLIKKDTVPIVIDWYSDIFLFDGKAFDHLPSPD